MFTKKYNVKMNLKLLSQLLYFFSLSLIVNCDSSVSSSNEEPIPLDISDIEKLALSSNERSTAIPVDNSNSKADIEKSASTSNEQTTKTHLDNSNSKADFELPASSSNEPAKIKLLDNSNSNADNEGDTAASESSQETTTYFDFSGQHRKKFAMEYFLAKKWQNMACSPISALMPLAKLALGAEGSSEKELMQAIGISSISKLGDKFRKTIKNLKRLRGVRLNIASKIYVSNQVNINKSFKKKAKKIFSTTTESVDFQNQEKTSLKINKWVARQSGKNILLNLDFTANGDESAIILNVVTFKGTWEKPFKKIPVKDFDSPRGIVSVPMMKRSDYFYYAKSDRLQAQIIEIPYMKREASFVIVLPKNKTGLPDLIKTIKRKPDLLNQAMKKMKASKVDLMMPRFKIESRDDIIPIYESCGVRKVFTRASGLNNIIESKISKKPLPLIVSLATHLTVIDVNEKGTVGAAATVLEKLMATAAKYQQVFHANHSFLFYVKSKEEQLFAGTFAGF